MTIVKHHSGYLDGIPTGPIADEDFDDILNFLDFPLESLEEDGLGVEWDAIESKFDDLMAFPAVPQGDNGNNQLKFNEAQGTGNFQTQSPVSVLEGSNSSSGGKSIPIKHDTVIPVRPRSKRARPSAVNPWILMAPISSTRYASKKFSDARKGKEKKRRLSMLSSAANESVKKKITSSTQQQSNVIKKCTHCEVTKTPQWREGPLGPKTLCNACGVRYRSGRLFPEYRPAASPTFIPSVHSNSHRKVVEMRKKREAFPEPTIVEDPPMSPAPEFVPMSNYLFDVY